MNHEQLGKIPTLFRQSLCNFKIVLQSALKKKIFTRKYFLNENFGSIVLLLLNKWSEARKVSSALLCFLQQNKRRLFSHIMLKWPKEPENLETSFRQRKFVKNLNQLTRSGVCKQITLFFFFFSTDKIWSKELYQVCFSSLNFFSELIIKLS